MVWVFPAFAILGVVALRAGIVWAVLSRGATTRRSGPDKGRLRRWRVGGGGTWFRYKEQ